MLGRTTVLPTRRAFAMFGGVLILFAVGTSVQAGWVLAIAALLGGMAVAGAFLAMRGLAGIEVTRIVPRTASAGQPLPVTLSVANRGSRARGLVLVSDNFCGKGSALARLVRPGQSKQFRGLRDECRRGVYDEGRATVETGFPFGVVRTRRRMTLTSSLIVFPRVYDVAKSPSSGGGGWSAPSPFGDVSSVRDYHVGDPLRHIHWRTVARRGQLVVREFDHERRAEMTIVASLPDDPDAADVVASIATSLAIVSLRDAGEVVLVSGPVATRDRSSDGVLEWGARLRPDDSLLSVVGDVPTSGVICVCASGAVGLDAFVARFSDRHPLVVCVGADRRRADALRGQGATVATVAPGEVEAWFAAGCAVS